MANDLPSKPELEPRQPTVEDLRDLCRELNARGTRYVVVGGFAIRAAGYIRETMHIDLIVARDRENETKVFSRSPRCRITLCASCSPVSCCSIMSFASPIVKQAEIREVDGVTIPFASPALLWRMKAVTHREKDEPDLLFLRQWFASRGEKPPPVSHSDPGAHEARRQQAQVAKRLTSCKLLTTADPWQIVQSTQSKIAPGTKH